MEETRATEVARMATEAGALPPRGRDRLRFGDDSDVKSAMWIVAILLDDMSDYLGVRLPHPTVADIVSYERRQAWVRDFLDSVRCYYAT